MKTVENYNILPLISLKLKQQTASISRNKHSVILRSLCRHCQSKQSKAEYGRRHKPGSPWNKLTFDLSTLKVVSESHVTWATCMPNLVFLCLSVLDLCPIYATDRRQTDVRQHHRLMPPPYRGGGINIIFSLTWPLWQWQDKLTWQPPTLAEAFTA